MPRSCCNTPMAIHCRHPTAFRGRNYGNPKPERTQDRTKGGGSHRCSRRKARRGIHGNLAAMGGADGPQDGDTLRTLGAVPAAHWHPPIAQGSGSVTCMMVKTWTMRPPVLFLRRHGIAYQPIGSSLARTTEGEGRHLDDIQRVGARQHCGWRDLSAVERGGNPP